jgi:predicted DCC family thiol-disulfide oxidoreductase YuxK
MSARIETPIVVYDAVCVLCCAGLRWIVRHDRRSHWRFLAMQSPRGTAALTAAGISVLAPTSFLVLYGAHCYIESDACLVIARDIGGIYGAMAAAGRLLPKSIRDAAYRLLARNRYRWFGRRQSCYVPTAEESHRYLAG